METLHSSDSVLQYTIGPCLASPQHTLFDLHSMSYYVIDMFKLVFALKDHQNPSHSPNDKK
jgi:hypothetical protein